MGQMLGSKCKDMRGLTFWYGLEVLEATKKTVPGAEAPFVAGLNVRAKARTYLRSNSNNKYDWSDFIQGVKLRD